jgi:replicative DNA helicase Mcm
MISDIEINDMEKAARDWVWENKDIFLSMMDKYIQRPDFRFPLDIKRMQVISDLNPEDVEKNYQAIYRQVFNLPEKEKMKALEQLDEKYTADAHLAFLHGIASDILKFLEEKPEEIIKQLNQALYDLMVQAGDEEKEDFYPPEFTLVNFGNKLKISDLEPTMIGRMRLFSGWVAYFSKVTIEYVRKVFKCPACGEEAESNGKLCPQCGYKGALKFLEDKSLGRSIQTIGLMENYEESRGNPSILDVRIYGKDINAFFPGDRVQIIGIIDTETKKSPTGFNVYFVLRSMEVSKIKEQYLPEEVRGKIIESPIPLEKLAADFAPDIIGPYLAIKKALLLQLVGSDNVKRNDIHILLIGDPGLGKSELLRFSAETSSKGMYISDASSAGLTASIMDINGNRAMVPGVLVLANHGIACIDEIEKMKKDDREGIHPAMEQGQFTKSKAGLTQTFQTQTAILAAANPVGSKWDPSRTIVEQISIEPSLLDRFDAIFLMESKMINEIDPADMLRKENKNQDLPLYIKAAREFKTTMPDNIFREISNLYKEIRKISGDLSINIRTFESMLRFTEASAKLSFHPECTYEDFLEMKDVMDSWLKQFNYSTGNVRGDSPSTVRWLHDAYSVLKHAGHPMKIDELKKEIAIDDGNWPKVSAVMKTSGNFYFPDDKRVAAI